MKCVFVICVLISFCVLSDALGFSTRTGRTSCRTPQMLNGRTRLRQRARIVKFLCLPGFDIVGNRYATCMNGEWDVPIPVCVRAGCPPLKELQNGIQLLSHQGAWSMFFCGPGYQLSGSSVLYCNGRNWNGSIPLCLDSSTPASTSCDFESADLCGWRNDELHDFDWRRLSKKTPSAFMSTGPSHDHTYGAGAAGHYMYVESTGKQKGDRARLISPVYDGKATRGGCFSFYYHMFGKTTGTLRVYVKPESRTILSLTSGFTDNRRSVWFEKSGNQGDVWFRDIFDLPDLDEEFQIVIEGVRGSSYTSDIAIDDVALLPSPELCKQERESMKPTVIPPQIVKDSCVNRCRKAELFTAEMEPVECSCLESCVNEYSCCVDFYELCEFSDDSSTTITAYKTTENEPPPQTMKLIASTFQALTKIITTTTTTTTTSPRPKPTTETTTTTIKPSTTVKPTTIVRSTTTVKPTTIRPKTTRASSTTKFIIPVIIFKTTSPAPFNATGLLKNTTTSNRNTTTLKTSSTTTTTTTTTTFKPITRPSVTTFKRTTLYTNNMKVSRTFENHNVYHELMKNATKQQNNKGKAVNTNSIAAPVVGVICGILLVTVAMMLMVRTRWFKDNMDRLRARAHDHRAGEEVRYLTQDDQLDFE